MPFVSYPKAAHQKAIELAESIANPGPHMADWYEAETAGFFRGLRCCLPSEAVGLIVMAHDEALEHAKNRKTGDGGDK